MGSGARKAEPVARSLMFPETAKVPLSRVQSYSNLQSYSEKEIIYVLDEPAAAGIIGNEKFLAWKGISVTDLR